MVLYFYILKKVMVILAAAILLLFPQCSCKMIEYYSKENTTFVRALNGLETVRFCGYMFAQRFTPIGFKVSSLPIDLKQRLHSFYEKFQDKKFPEFQIPVIWRSDTENSSDSENVTNYISSGFDMALSSDLKNEIRLQLEEWTGIKNLKHTATYGIREYTRGAVLKPHIDCPDSHVLSAIINAGQETDEPWPLVAFDHNRERHEIFLNDTIDVILYESATVIHGRPYPLKGTSFANIFVHFAPSSWEWTAGSSIKTCIEQIDLLCPEYPYACTPANFNHYITDRSLIIDICDHSYQRAADLSRVTNRLLPI